MILFTGYKALGRLYLGRFTLADDFFVQNVNYRGKIGVIIPISKPNNLPKFDTPEQAIEYVSNIPYSQFISNPSEVLEENAGSCLGKARLLYFLSKEQGFEIGIKKYTSHIRIEYKGKIIEL